jgi:hypothetical protein
LTLHLGLISDLVGLELDLFNFLASIFHDEKNNHWQSLLACDEIKPTQLIYMQWITLRHEFKLLFRVRSCKFGKCLAIVHPALCWQMSIERLFCFTIELGESRQSNVIVSYQLFFLLREHSLRTPTNNTKLKPTQRF